jgi:hypothetical protein
VEIAQKKFLGGGAQESTPPIPPIGSAGNNPSTSALRAVRITGARHHARPRNLTFYSCSARDSPAFQSWSTTLLPHAMCGIFPSCFLPSVHYSPHSALMHCVQWKNMTVHSSLIYRDFCFVCFVFFRWGPAALPRLVLNSWAQVILLPQTLEWLGLQGCITMPSLMLESSLFHILKNSHWIWLQWGSIYKWKSVPAMLL